MSARATTRSTAPPPISREGRASLLRLACHSIDAAIAGAAAPPVDVASLPADVLEPASAFVTLREDGELRGCMGRLDEGVPCWRNVVSAAQSAAVDDPRFTPVDVSERSRLEVEISVLGPFVEVDDPADVIAGLHGIVVERGGRRALLLPQVAPENGWGTIEMLSACCWKAGLPQDAWRYRDTRLLAFTALVFGTADEIAAEDRADEDAEDTADEDAEDTADASV
ncbi:MAG TPA: AmmeMemoRadiSam system protein A [Candidatus Limnocylindrales bacterium]